MDTILALPVILDNLIQRKRQNFVAYIYLKS